MSVLMTFCVNCPSVGIIVWCVFGPIFLYGWVPGTLILLCAGDVFLS